jgi:hypothetical protein
MSHCTSPESWKTERGRPVNSTLSDGFRVVAVLGLVRVAEYADHHLRSGGSVRARRIRVEIRGEYEMPPVRCRIEKVDLRGHSFRARDRAMPTMPSACATSITQGRARTRSTVKHGEGHLPFARGTAAPFCLMPMHPGRASGRGEI